MFGRKVDAELVALSVLAGAEAAHSFSAQCPSAFTIRTFALDGDTEVVQAKLANLRAGYQPATLFGLLVGGAVSALSRSPLPLLFSIGASGLMIASYEAHVPADYRLTIPQAVGLLLSGRAPQATPTLADPNVIDLPAGSWREVGG